jgi:LysR family hydrogen peroxide-inducible transcriptional activator
MTITQLEYALTVQRTGSFVSAARNLQISQPALSQQINKLEKEVGIVLFDRSVQPIVCTDDGDQFLLRAQEIVSSSRSLLNFSEELQNTYSGDLYIGIIPTLSPFLVPLFTPSLQEDFPDLKLDISEMITEQVVDKVRRGDLDAGIISTPIHAVGIKSEPLFYEKFFIYAPGRQDSVMKMNIRNLNTDELWLLEEGNCFRDQVTDLCHLNTGKLSKPMKYRCNSIDSLIRIVDHQGGITILPELTTISLNEDQLPGLAPVEGKVREIGLITRTAVAKTRFIKVLKEYILNNIPGNLKSNEGLEIVDPALDIGT